MMYDTMKDRRIGIPEVIEKFVSAAMRSALRA